MTSDSVTPDRARDALLEADLDPVDVDAVVRRALAEDLRLGTDVTSAATVPADAAAVAVVAARQPGVVAGIPIALAVLAAVGSSFEARVHCADASTVGAGDEVLEISGSARALLLAERTLLNFLAHLSGIATLTRAWVDAVAGSGAVIRDTRKTTPGLRQLEKYAVRCGGGRNHRFALGDAVLIKDNHIEAADGVAAAVRAVRAHAPGLRVEVECDTLEQVREAIAAGATELLLDNMSLADMSAAVSMARAVPGVTTEASGGLVLDAAADVAATGVTYLAVGALTHSSPALDLGLDFRGASARQRPLWSPPLHRGRAVGDDAV
jgi:nicotinate-nucleotide pyrophosphorylase (carboxylating)